jgi:hypothetical protein
LLLGFWLILAPAASAWAAFAATPTPCEAMGGMGEPPADGCCGGGMDAAACLSACIGAATVIVTGAAPLLPVELAQDGVPGISLRYATVLAPPDIAPPKSFVS